MRASISPIELQTDLLHSLDAETLGCSFSPPSSWLSKCKGMQTGGSRLAWKTLEDFFHRRGRDYYRSISSPTASRTACTRLSPYLAWGNISLREVYQYLLKHWQVAGFRPQLNCIVFTASLALSLHPKIRIGIRHGVLLR